MIHVPWSFAKSFGKTSSLKSQSGSMASQFWKPKQFWEETRIFGGLARAELKTKMFTQPSAKHTLGDI